MYSLIECPPGGAGSRLHSGGAMQLSSTTTDHKA